VYHSGGLGGYIGWMLCIPFWWFGRIYRMDDMHTILVVWKIYKMDVMYTILVVCGDI
jgi:hypothetical protein